MVLTCSTILINNDYKFKVKQTISVSPSSDKLDSN